MLGKPVLEMLFFTLALAVKETAQHHFPAQRQARVGREHHVRQTGPSRDAFHLRVPGQDLVKRPPLPGGGLARGLVQVALHPGINHVIHVVLVGRAHEKTNGRGHTLLWAGAAPGATGQIPLKRFKNPRRSGWALSLG